MDAGKLRERLAFDKRADLAEPGNGSGTKRGDWVEQFERWAGLQYLRGGETVLASRLAGVQPDVITVRRDSQTKLIDASWRARDLNSGAIYNLKAPQPSPDKAGIDFLADTGTAIG